VRRVLWNAARSNAITAATAKSMWARVARVSEGQGVRRTPIGSSVLVESRPGSRATRGGGARLLRAGGKPHGRCSVRRQGMTSGRLADLFRGQQPGGQMDELPTGRVTFLFTDLDPPTPRRKSRTLDRRTRPYARRLPRSVSTPASSFKPWPGRLADGEICEAFTRVAAGLVPIHHRYAW
jgi:hypothetical protein